MLGVWFGAETVVQHWQDESDTDARAFIKSAPPSLPVSLSFSTPEALFVLARHWPGRQRVNKAAAVLLLIVWMNKWLLEDSVNARVIEARIIVSSKISDIFQTSNTFLKQSGLWILQIVWNMWTPCSSVSHFDVTTNISLSYWSHILLF